MISIDFGLAYIHDFIAWLGVLVIFMAALRSAYQLIVFCLTRRITMQLIRLDFGNAIILGLEFLVGADIISSVVQPDYYNLGVLAILVLIRTILSYFLNKELSQLS